MGANKNEFIKLRMAQEDYSALSPSIRESMEVDLVEITGIDYSNDPLWNELKKESSTAYRKLKDREYELRHIHGYKPKNERNDKSENK